MIIASDFRLDHFADHILVSCGLKGDGFPDRMIFRLPHTACAAVDVAEPNWAAMALLYPAMMMGQDLTIEADLSPRLLYNMRNDLMALMRNYEPQLKDIQIEAGLSTPQIPDGPRDTMTGFSGGVDSFSTFVLFTRPDVPPSLRLTALAVFQVGALGPTEIGETLLEPARERCEVHAKDHGLNTYSLSSNMDAVFAPAGRFGPIDFRRTVGLRNSAAALLLQNGVDTYLPSGSVNYRSATYGPYSCTESLDPVLQPLLATEKLRVHPAGAGLSRIDKIALIADNPEAHQRLNVCVSQVGNPRPTTTLNCSACWKCAQTLLVLEVLGKEDLFRPVFDVDYYRTNRARLLQELSIRGKRMNSTVISENIAFARRHGIHVPEPRSALELRIRRIAWRVLKGVTPDRRGSGVRASPQSSSAAPFSSDRP
jgi:hypothetical protein